MDLGISHRGHRRRHPAEALAHVFEPFYQADSSARRRHGGTGLGLAISHRLAELLHGSLTVASRVGAGSEFRLTLRAPGISTLPRTESASGTPSVFHGARVLVVEDHDINRRLCALQLRKLGCETQFAVDGHEAVRRFAEGTFDVVLMDMQLPDWMGAEPRGRFANSSACAAARIRR